MFQTQALGPWSGGLNLSSGKDLSPFLNRDELGIALNVNLSSEGFVTARPGCRVLDSVINTGTSTITVLGTIQIVREYVVVIQVKDGVNTLIYYVRGDKSVTLKATMDLNLSFSSVLALNNVVGGSITTESPKGVFLFSETGENQCYRLELLPALVGAVTPVLMSSVLLVPKSHRSFAVKDRVILIDYDASELHWAGLLEDSLFFDEGEIDVESVPTPRALTTGSVIMDPSIDSSDNVTDAEFLNNSFYVFKKNSTYLFTYQADPENDGYLRKINANLGAFDSTVFRNTVVVINNKGVFSVEGTNFIDLQRKLDLRFETDLDRLTSIDAFISSHNNEMLIGYRVEGGEPSYYLLNALNRGWTQWDFSYHDAPIASPGASSYFAEAATGVGILLAPTFDNSRLVYFDWKPDMDNYEYHLDSSLVTDTEAGNETRYIPKVNLQLKASIGDSPLAFKKLYRTYIRFYISDVLSSTYNNSWRMSINYNEYYFQSTNPQFILYPENTVDNIPSNRAMTPTVLALVGEDTVIYKRTYQIPIPQHRVKEFAAQIQRDYTELVDVQLNNPDADRSIQQGYYFRLSGFWFQYQDKAGI